MVYQYKKTINEFELDTLNREIESFCERNDVPVSKLFSIQLIIEELVTNIVKYGQGDGNKGTIEVKVKIEGQQIRLIISDDTTAFNPLDQEEANPKLTLKERQVGGLGLFLVRKKVKALSYEHQNGFNVLIAVI